MQYAMLGRSGLPVSRLSLGAMTFTGGNQSMPSINKVDLSLADRLVGRAIDGGINFFDTADVYDRGQSEEVLGTVLKPRRQDVVIATKCGIRSGAALTRSGLSARHIHASVDASLKRLGTDWIDVFICHRADPLVPLEETLRALDEIVRAGKVRYLGYSNWPAWRAATAVEMQRANGWARFTHGQMHYSALIRDIERDTIPMMAHHGLGLTAWSPLAWGFLTGRITRENLASGEHRFGGGDIFEFDRDKGFALVDRLRGIAAAHGATPAQVAIAWLLAKPALTSVLLGTTKIEQLEDNLAAATLQLSGEDLAAIDEAMPPVPAYPDWFEAKFADAPLRKALGG
ncbi:aldo/keto reductase [Sphingomonas sp. ID0503]|uniref:aldo/keto reductase n=1 Tax=Sphingomonas sp. ID0503 TaxID=3399691 RepID=UPI003AFB5893